MMKVLQKITLVLIILSISKITSASTLSGKVTDEKGSPLAFASVYVKGTTSGVTTNLDGNYSLPLLPGNYEIICAYVGYIKKSQIVLIGNSNVVLNIQLQSEATQLKGVNVIAGEDPAYAVIRAAIKKRSFYQNQVDGYSCKVYIKGMQRLDSIPKKILIMNADKIGLDSSMLGIVYLSESESEYNFKQTDKVKEEMVSSKVSGDNKAFSWNSASDFDFNFYKNSMSAGSLSDRDFISPIAETALLYYKYHMVGAYVEDGQLINKIQVIPRGKSNPTFSGYIYIVSDSWRIHSADMWLTKDANIDFVDSLEVKQSFAKANDTVFMPINQTMLFQFTAFGIKGKGRYVGIFSNYNINPDFPKKFFKGEQQHIDEDANKKDSLYWDLNRPVPLTKEEIDDYRKKDSLARFQNTKQFLDSVDLKRNKFSASDLITGYSFYRRSTKEEWSTGSAFNYLNYNTIQGFAPTFNFRYYRELKDKKWISIETELQYGFSNEKLNARAFMRYSFKPEKLRWLNISGGRFVQQFNSEEPINPLINSIYTLTAGSNFMKIFENNFVRAIYQTELFNGFKIGIGGSYNIRNPLENTTGFSLVDESKRNFTANFPYAKTWRDNFSSYNSLILGAKIFITFKQKYYTRPHEKIITGSKYPKLIISYTKGIPTLGSNENFDQLELEVTDKLHFGIFGESEYSISGGKFLNNKQVGIAELKHFNGNETKLAPVSHMRSFNLLPYYIYSTDNYYLEGHYEHHFKGLLLNRIPLIKKLKWQEVGGAHLLMTDKINYAEFSVGIEHILKIFRIDFVTSYSNTQKLRAGFLFGVSSNGLIQIN